MAKNRPPKTLGGRFVALLSDETALDRVIKELAKKVKMCYYAAHANEAKKGECNERSTPS